MITCDRCQEPFAVRFTLTRHGNEDGHDPRFQRQIDICPKCLVSLTITLLNQIEKEKRFAIIVQFMKGIIL